MSKIKVTFVAIIAACSFATVSVAAAQAHEYKVNGNPLTGSENLKSSTETVIKQELLGTPFGVATHIICKSTHQSGSITAPSSGKASLEFSSCEVTKPSNCKVKEPILTSVKTTLVGPSPGVEVEFAPESGETFTKITLEGTECAIKEPFNVTGTQTCKLPGGETEAVAHKIECTTAGSKLKAGGKTATFSGGIESLELEHGAKWSSV